MIKNLSEIRRLRRVGKIHLGVKLPTGRGTEFPKAVDYFVVKADESTPAAAAEAFKKVYGDAPKEINVMFPVDQVEIWWDSFYKSYVRTQTTGGKLICKGNGETANRLNMQTGELEEVLCAGPEDCPFAQPEREDRPYKCKRVGTLQFLIPSVEILGVWQIDTSSFNGIVALSSDIDMIRSVTGGRIAMIPLVLKIVPKKANVEGKQSIIHHLTVEWRGEFKKLIALGQEKRGQLAYQVEKPNPDEVPEDLMPMSTLPVVAGPAAAQAQQPKPAPAVQPAQDQPKPQPKEDVQEAEVEDEREVNAKFLELTNNEIFLLADKGVSPEAGKAMKANFKSTVDFIRHIGTLPARKPAPAQVTKTTLNTTRASASKPAPAAAQPAAKPATPPAPPAQAADLTDELNAEFERLKWSEVKREALMKGYPDKSKLLAMLRRTK